MKKLLTLFVFVFGVSMSGFSQSNYPNIEIKEYDQMKQNGTLPKDYFTKDKSLQTPFVPAKPHNILNDIPKKKQGNGNPGRAPVPPAPNYCTCLQQIDASYSVAPICQGTCLPPDYRNDDGSTVTPISLPFTFCFYGNNYNSVYINNNGNITFGAPYTSFTATGFPATGPIMIAPFWADVDTRNTSSGLVYYKVTPTYMIVQWKDVGYYSQYVDKLNTFQVIISDGSDPILQPGMNVGYCYGDMQWTTGDANGGGGTGFGGTAANVGANKGDGTTYFQMGRFDQPGALYDGPYGNNDGIDWLDNKSFYADVCNGTNIAPIVSGFNSCDTIHACGLGDTTLLSGVFLSPENGQTINVAINLNGTPGASIVYNNPGNTAFAAVMVVASTLNAGINIITFTATDNGTPVGTTIVNVQVYVDLAAIPPHPILSGNQAFCVGDSIQLTVSPNTFTSYLWSTGSNTNTTWVHTAGQYWVVSTLNGCPQTDFVTVTPNPLPTPLTTGVLTTACGTGTTILSVDSTIYSSYHWSNGSTTSSITVPAGTYVDTVTDANGCRSSAPPVTVITYPPPIITALNDTTILCGQNANISVAFTGATVPSACGVTTNVGCTGPVTIGTVGTGAQSCTNYSYPAPFGNEWTSTTQQYLYTAAELNAAGIVGGKINELEWDVTLIDPNAFTPIATTYHEFDIKMGCTNLTTFPSFNPTLVTGLYDVFPSSTVNVTTGWNPFIFSSAFEWDGVSNVIVQICFSQGPPFPSYTGNCQTAMTNTSYTSTIVFYSDQSDQCTNPNGFTQTANAHPDMRLHSCSVAQNPSDFTYHWTSNPSGGNIADTTAQITTAQPFTNTTYHVLVTNNNGGCTATDSVRVTLLPINHIVITPVPPYCLGSNIDTLQVLTLVGAHPMPLGSVVWTGAGITDSTLGVFNPAIAGVGNHTIHCTIPPSICGSADTSIVITVLNQFDPTIDPVAPLCSSYSPITLHAAHAGGSWSGPGITDTINGIFDPTIAGVVGNNIISYTIYFPCFSRDTVVIPVTQQLDATIDPPGGPYCVGILAAPNVQLTSAASAGVAGTWSGQGIVDPIAGIFNPHVAGPGVHTITHNLTYFCGDTATTTITVIATPVIAFTPSIYAGCAPITVNFTSITDQPGGTYHWDFGDSYNPYYPGTDTVQNPTHTFTNYNGGVPYTVTLIYTNTNGCADTLTHVGLDTVYSQPSASFSVTPQPTDITAPEIYFLDHSTGVINNWTWTFGDAIGSTDQNPTHSYADTGSYHVQLIVINNNGCVDTARGLVVIDPILTCYIPNAFTPDGDGHNDEFRVMGSNIQKDGFEMHIFDRWGEQMFFTSDLLTGWNGRRFNSGDVLEEGVYVYKINLKDWKGLDHQYIGNVTIVR